MRGLHGDFGTMPVKELVSYLGNRRATGVLALSRGEVNKKALLREGCVVNASSNMPREYLGQFLINLGQITEEQFNRAYQTQKETKVYLGKILTMIGIVNEQTVLNALNLKARETVLDTFRWEDGSFEFDPDAPLDTPDGLDLRVDLLDIHREGEFRETAWQAIHNAFPNGQVRLRLDESKLPERPKPGSLDARLFELIREDKTIDELVLALHATDFFLYQRLYALYRLEAVRVSDDLPPPPPADEPFDLGFEPPSVLVPDPPPAGAELMVEGVVPALKVTHARIKTMQLSAPERYLLSRVDGARDVASIVNASPLQQQEAVKLFQKLVDQGLVTVARR